MTNILILRTVHIVMIVLLQIKLTLVRDAKNLSLTSFIPPLMFIGILRALFVRNAKRTLKIVASSLPKISLII